MCWNTLVWTECFSSSVAAKRRNFEDELRKYLLYPSAETNKAAVLPLVKKDGLSVKAKEIFNDLKSICNCAYDEKDSIGKRYRRNDAIGTPFCITVDYESIENNSVTVRERDSMNQERIKISELSNFIDSKVNMNILFWNYNLF